MVESRLVTYSRSQPVIFLLAGFVVYVRFRAVQGMQNLLIGLGRFCSVPQNTITLIAFGARSTKAGGLYDRHSKPGSALLGQAGVKRVAAEPRFSVKYFNAGLPNCPSLPSKFRHDHPIFSSSYSGAHRRRHPDIATRINHHHLF